VTEDPIRRISLIGFGEAGGIFGHDLAAAGFEVAMYDILLNAAPARAGMLEKAQLAKVRACDTLAEAIRGAYLVISAVTASAALHAAECAAPLLSLGQIYLDINSVSPETKRAIAGAMETYLATFVEAAVMAPVAPQRLRVPVLLGGPAAAAAAPRLQAIGMNARPISERVGVASAIKMCRSIIIKGLEAITVESLLTARRYGAEKEVLDSLAATYPGMGWDGALPDYLVSRVAEHGKRRAAEMREAAQTIREAGLEPLTALATAERQEWLARVIAESSVRLAPGEPFEWQKLAEAIVEATALKTESGRH